MSAFVQIALESSSLPRVLGPAHWHKNVRAQLIPKPSVAHLPPFCSWQLNLNGLRGLGRNGEVLPRGLRRALLSTSTTAELWRSSKRCCAYFDPNQRRSLIEPRLCSSKLLTVFPAKATIPTKRNAATNLCQPVCMTMRPARFVPFGELQNRIRHNRRLREGGRLKGRL